MPVTNSTAVGLPTAGDSSRLAPPGYELRPVSSSTTAISVGSVRELKPKREKDWREAFSPPPDENLIETHGCALARELLIHGRIYVSAVRFYFKSNILGYKTMLDFPLSSVVAIGPRMTALVIPNSLELVVQGGEVYQFCTLNDRDGTLDILLALWQAQAPEAFAAFAGRKSPEEAIELRARAASVSSFRSRASSVDAVDDDTQACIPGDAHQKSLAEGIDRSTPIAHARRAPTAPAGSAGRSDEKTTISRSPTVKLVESVISVGHRADLSWIDQLLKDSFTMALTMLAGLLLLTNAYLLLT